MTKSAVAAFSLALAIGAVGCGGPTPENVCEHLKSMDAMPAGCEGAWTAKKTATPDVFKKQAACVMAAHGAQDAAKCSQTPTP